MLSLPANSVDDVVSDLGRVLNQEAEESRRQGGMTDGAIRAIEESRIAMMLAPTEFGGAGASLPAWLDALTELMRCDGPSGWSIMTTSAHVGLLSAFLPEEGVKKLFDGIDHPRLPGMSAGIGRAERVPGGYRISGKWQFASGSDLATAFVGGALVYENDQVVQVDGVPMAILAPLPRESVTHLGNWDVDGLEPTRSIDYSVEDLFVEGSLAMQTSPAPSENVRGATGLRIGFPPLGALMHGAAAIAFAQRILEEIAALAPKRARTPGQAVADDPLFKYELARSERVLASARAEYQLLLADAMNYVEQFGGPLEEVRTARIRAHGAYLQEVGMECATMAHTWAGSSAFRNNGAIGRYFKDMSVAKQHAFVDRGVIVEAADAVRPALAANLDQLA